MSDKTSVHPALDAAERIAPVPETREQATTEAWVRHYAALALAAHVEFRRALPPIGSKPGSRPELGYLVEIGVAATAAVVALTNTDPAEVGGELWDLTPEAGALNGEWEDYLDGVLVGVGINPADINDYLDPAGFAAMVSR
jgi:hypothetical protein